ncbi:MAG: heavy-metal-associated domain-containing protein [Bacteroidia bacterium]
MLLPVLLLFAACNSHSGSEKELTAHVWGNNEKCKATIEKASRIDGVSKADWSIESKLLTLKFDTLKVNLDQILESVAHAGYDNEKYYADDYTYGALPPECQYERRPFESK